MAKAIIINRYEDCCDRGVVVNHSLKESVEVDVAKISVTTTLHSSNWSITAILSELRQARR